MADFGNMPQPAHDLGEGTRLATWMVKASAVNSCSGLASMPTCSIFDPASAMAAATWARDATAVLDSTFDAHVEQAPSRVPSPRRSILRLAAAGCG